MTPDEIIAAQATELARLREEVAALVREQSLCKRCKLPVCMIPVTLLDELVCELAMHYSGPYRISKGDWLEFKAINRDYNSGHLREMVDTAWQLIATSPFDEIKELATFAKGMRLH